MAAKASAKATSKPTGKSKAAAPSKGSPSKGRGGARPGAGRKRKAEKFEHPVAAAEQRLADRLPKTIDTLIELADGGLELVEEVYEPAGTILIDGFEILVDDKGKQSVSKVKKPAFPNLPADTLVLVKRVRSITGPDRVVAIYLADRVMGKPTERHEIEQEVTGEIEITNQALQQAAKELSEWRRQMTEQLNLPSAPPMSPTSPTTTAS